MDKGVIEDYYHMTTIDTNVNNLNENNTSIFKQPTYERFVKKKKMDSCIYIKTLIWCDKCLHQVYKV